MNDDAFRAMVIAFQAESGLDDDQVAVLLGVSRPTVTRWRTGKTAPHASMKWVVAREFRRHKERGQ